MQLHTLRATIRPRLQALSVLAQHLVLRAADAPCEANRYVTSVSGQT